MSHDDTNRLEHQLAIADNELEVALHALAYKIQRHALLKTLPTHDDIAQWSSSIERLTKAQQSAERAIEVRNMHEQSISARLQ
jgi:hypothetical protein